MEMKNMKLRTSRNLPNHSVLLLSVRLDDSTPNISIIWASIILLTVTVTVSNKMWSFPFNIAQSLNYKPATSAWGCNMFELKLTLPKQLKRVKNGLNKWRHLAWIYTSASSNPVFWVNLNFKKTSTSPQLVGRSNFIPNKPMLCQ